LDELLIKSSTGANLAKKIGLLNYEEMPRSVPIGYYLNEKLLDQVRETMELQKNVYAPQAKKSMRAEYAH
jgi:hypothetical protein